MKPPKALYQFRAGMRTAFAARRLKHPGKVDRPQKAAFKTLTASLSKSVYGADCQIAADMPYEAFQRNIPLQTIESITPLVERAAHGEPDLLWPGYCPFFAQTAGTTTGKSTLLPVTEEWLRHFRHATHEAQLFYTARTGHAGIFHGKQLFIAAATNLLPLIKSDSISSFAGGLAALATLNMPDWYEEHFFEPGTEIAGIQDWEQRLAATVDRTVSEDIGLIAGTPSDLLGFFHTLRRKLSGSKTEIQNIRAVWPNLECVIHTGSHIDPYLEEIRSWIGLNTDLHEVYAATEGFIAAQDSLPGDGLRVLSDSGLFFEFIPLSDFKPDSGESASAAVPLSEVNCETDYLLVITSPAGLCRFVNGDIVRFTSTRPHRLVLKGRRDFLLNQFGEALSDRAVSSAMAAVCRKHGWFPSFFHVSPLVDETTSGQPHGAHEWWIELRAPCNETPISNVIAAELDTELRRMSREYNTSRATRSLDAPVVRLVAPGVFEAWLRINRQWEAQRPVPPCLPNRRLADQLSSLAGFHRTGAAK